MALVDQFEKAKSGAKQLSASVNFESIQQLN
jgi:hypothetical protein